MLVSDLINEAFLDIGMIQPGQAVTGAMQTDAFTRLNQMLASWSAEQLTVFDQRVTSFQLQAGIPTYTFGVGGSFNPGVRAQKVTAWRASYGNVLMRGGRVLSLDELGAVATQEAGEQTAVPKAVGADTSYPLINVRIFPPPSSSPGQLELAYWVPIAAFATVGDTVNFPSGFEDALHFGLAVRLYHAYPRQGGIPPELAANAQNTKAAIVQQNTMGAAPQQQQQAQ